MNSPDQKLEKQVEKILDEDLEWKEIQEGINDIYLISSEKNEFVLKVHTNKHQSSVSYKKDQKARFRAESKIYKLVSDSTGIASPEIIYEDFTEDKYEHGFYIMEKIDGENLEDYVDNLTDEKLETVIYQYGKILGQIHGEIEFDNYGLILCKDQQLGLLDGKKSWSESFEDMLQNLEELIEDRWNKKPNLYLSEIERKTNIIPENPSSALLHSDNRLENVLVENGEIEGFLDWSFCRAGHDKYDLVRAEYLLIDYDLEHLDKDTRERLREQLLKGYKETNSLEGDYFDELRQLYRYITVLWIIAGFPNWSSHWEKERKDKFAENLKKRLKKEV